MTRSDGQKAAGGAPEAPSGGYWDPMARKNKRLEDKALESRYNQLCGPVTVRKADSNGD